MAMVICDRSTEDEIKARRAALGQDLLDEVWDGVYIVSPSPNFIHQKLVSRFLALLEAVIDNDRLGQVAPAVNISDREGGWTDNFRVPDIAVFLAGTAALYRETHWVGGPDFAVEILSKGDRAFEKFDFYARVGVREVLIVDRDPWGLELYRLDGGSLRLVGRAKIGSSGGLASWVVPLTFRMVEGEGRPWIEAAHDDGVRRWSI